MEWGKEYVVPLRPYQKRLNIYRKTKNRRIKRKQEKLCPLIQLSNQIIKYVGIPNNFKNFKVYINGKEINK